MRCNKFGSAIKSLHRWAFVTWFCEQQQLRAVVAESEILLLDEITTNLDAETEHQVLQALKRASENSYQHFA